MTRRKRRRFSDLTPIGRKRIRNAGSRWGLSARQSREMWERGTFRPFARDPYERVPQIARLRPREYRESFERSYREMDALRERIVMHARDILIAEGRRFEENQARRMRARLDMIRDPLLLYHMLGVSGPQWREYARADIFAVDSTGIVAGSELSVDDLEARSIGQPYDTISDLETSEEQDFIAIIEIEGEVIRVPFNPFWYQ